MGSISKPCERHAWIFDAHAQGVVLSSRYPVYTHEAHERRKQFN